MPVMPCVSRATPKTLRRAPPPPVAHPSTWKLAGAGLPGRMLLLTAIATHRRSVAREPQQLRCPGRAAQHHEDALVPSPLAQPDNVRKPGEDFVRGCDGRERVFAACTLGVGHRQARRDHVARMAGTLGDIGIVAVEIAHHDRVRECGHLHRGEAAGTEYAGGRLTAGGGGKLARNGCRLARITADSARDGIDEASLELPYRAGGQLVVFQCRCILRVSASSCPWIVPLKVPVVSLRLVRAGCGA